MARIIGLGITVVIFIWWVMLYYVWYLAGWFNSDNECEDEITELKKEIKWWERQCKMLSEENNRLKQQLIWSKKKTIAERNEEDIRTLWNEWLSDKEIAEIIGCGKSTIQRAIKKFWLR